MMGILKIPIQNNYSMLTIVHWFCLASDVWSLRGSEFVVFVFAESRPGLVAGHRLFSRFRFRLLRRQRRGESDRERRSFEDLPTSRRSEFRPAFPRQPRLPLLAARSVSVQVGGRAAGPDRG